jgi:hypothetical protein
MWFSDCEMPPPAVNVLEETMKKIRQFGAVLAAMTMFAASTFADDRPRNGSDWRGGRGNDRGWERRDDRGARNLSAQGRITNLHRENGGYRIQLDRGSQWYFVPQSAWSRHRAGRNVDLRVGVSIRLGGGHYGDRGYIYCDDIDYIEDGYGYRDRDRHRDNYVSGTVRRIDYRRDIVELREQRTGHVITVDARRADRRSRRGIDVADLRRGDYVEFEGNWVRGNVFQARRIDGLDSRR